MSHELPGDGRYSLGMRIFRAAQVIGTLSVLLAMVGCSQLISGTAQRDSTSAPLALSVDGYGIVAGYDDAPARIEIFTEPQCRHCSDLQRDFGDALHYHVNVGSLQITYRPLTFMDDDYDGYSSTVANALFLAAQTPVSGVGPSGSQFQRFVEELWVNQDAGGRSFTPDELRDMASSAGMPDPIADTVAREEEAVDIAEMEDTNFGFLFDIDPVQTGTPTVFDLEAGEKLDIYDDDWLDNLVQS